MNKNNTKRNLLMSVLSLLLCCSMLVGSTFAWFTDSVASRNNVITSGNLDVELQYSTNGTTWTTVDENTVLFDAADLWEPGHTVAVALRVINKGSLAFEYALATTIYLEEAGTNVFDKEFKLSDVLEVYVTETTDAASLLDDRADVLNGTKTTFNTDLATSTKLLPNATEDFVVAITMPTTVGNEANHNGEDVPSIQFGVELVATQAMHEEDSFGDDYDEDAEFLQLPAAKVGELPAGPVNATIGMNGSTVETIELAKAFRFETTETKDQAQQGDYRYWHADFVVTTDKDIPVDSMALAGYYAYYCEDFNDGNWVALVNEDGAITAGTQIRLLELMLNGGSMNYEELCEYVPTFDCGLADLTGENTGTTVTVELRLYEVEDNAASTSAETGHYITVGTYSYKF